MYDEISEMIGKVMASVEVKDDNTVMSFIDVNGNQYIFYHEQDCCESVEINDICGDLNDLVGNPILEAEEVAGVGFGPLNRYEESFTWTFYKFATIKGNVTVRWYGSSNSYYSKSVDFRIQKVK